MQVPLISFRDGGHFPCHLARNESKKEWITADSFGNILTMDKDSNKFRQTTVCDQLISAISIHPEGNSSCLSCDGLLYQSEYPVEASKLQRTVVRNTLPMTKVQYDSSGSLIFVASEEPDLTVFSAGSDCVDRVISTAGMGVRTFALTDKSTHLAVVDVSGGVKIHRLEFSADKLAGGGSLRLATCDVVHSMHDMVHKVVARSHSMGCRVAWYPGEDNRVALALPSVKGSVVILLQDGNKWTEHFLLPDPGSSISHKENHVNLVAFSPNGRYLASADMSGRVLVWDFDVALPSQSCPIRMVEGAGQALVDLGWGTEEGSNYLLLLSADSFGRADNVIAASKQAPTEVLSALPKPIKALSPTASPVKTKMASPVATAPATGEVSDPMEVDSGTATAPAARKRLVRASAEARDYGDDDLFADSTLAWTAPAASVAASRPPLTADESASTSLHAIKSQARGLRVTDDDPAEGVYEEEEGAYDDDPADVDDQAAADIQEVLRLAKQITGDSSGALLHAKLQPAFQPSSTKPDDKQMRYLVWNGVGSITSRDESVENRIEIRFANTIGANKNEYFADRTGFVMAALSFEGAVFASEPEEDVRGANQSDEFKREMPGSTIYYHAFANQKQLEGMNESFRHTLSDSEAVLAVAAGRGWVAAATSKNLLRVFSSTGVQTKIVWLSGPVVCLCGAESSLAVIYHGGLPLDDTFQLKTDLYEISWRDGGRGRATLKGACVPMSQKSTLTWAGMDSDLQLLTVVDSAGMVSVLTKSLGGAYEWTPVLDIHKVRKTIDHVYWPVSVKNDKLVYVLLNGESRPAVYPQPVVATKQLRIPMACLKEGKEVSDVQRERLHQLIWSDVKTAHLEALRSDLAALGPAAPVYDGLSQLEQQLDEQQLAHDKHVLNLFQDACQHQRQNVALSLALRLRTEKGAEGAIKVANYFGRTAVASAVDSMLQRRRALVEEMTCAAEGFVDSAEVGDSYERGNKHEDREALSEPVHLLPPAGSLSSKLSAKQLPPSGRNTAKVVSPPGSGAPGLQQGMNPFAVGAGNNTPVKRKSAFEGIQDLRASPSPKKSSLNRSSSFSQSARMQKMGDKTIL